MFRLLNVQEQNAKSLIHDIDNIVYLHFYSALWGLLFISQLVGRLPPVSVIQGLK